MMYPLIIKFRPVDDNFLVVLTRHLALRTRVSVTGERYPGVLANVQFGYLEVGMGV